MRHLSPSKRTAIEAIASGHSASWRQGRGNADAYLVRADARIALEVANWPGVRSRPAPRPHLRYDKGALDLVRRARANLDGDVPDGETVLLSVTAPIRLRSRTTAAVSDRARALLTGPVARRELTTTIHGNRICLSIVRDCPRGAAKLVGFVHNPESDPRILFDITRALLSRLAARARTHRRVRSTGNRWLVIASEENPSLIGAYRDAYSQLSMPLAFHKVLMVFAGGRVEALGDSNRRLGSR